MSKFDKLRRALTNMAAGANTSCRDFSALLIEMKFELVPCGSAGHMIAKHPAVALQHYPNFDCGHDPGTKVKRVYIKKLARFVDEYADAIKEHLK